jgi:uncharacterized protein (DUF1330 family)
MSVYAIAHLKVVENHEMLAEYAAKVGATIDAHQGRMIVRDEMPEIIEGSIEYPATVVVEFPSMTAFRQWYNSPEYQAILPLRLKSTAGSVMVVKGLTPS